MITPHAWEENGGSDFILNFDDVDVLCAAKVEGCTF